MKFTFEWKTGFPATSGMYLVQLADGEMCVTPWNDGTGKNRDSWGDERQTGWHCLTDSRSTVKRWVSIHEIGYPLELAS